MANPEIFFYRVEEKEFYQRTLGARQTIEILSLFKDITRQKSQESELAHIVTRSETEDEEDSTLHVDVDVFTLLTWIKPFLGQFLGTILIPSEWTPEEFVEQGLNRPGFLRDHGRMLEARLGPDEVLSVLSDFLFLAPVSTILQRVLKFMKNLGLVWDRIAAADQELQEQAKQSTFVNTIKRYEHSSVKDGQGEKVPLGA